MGMTATVRSVTTLEAEAMYESTVAMMGGQHVPGTRLSQYLARGWHWLTMMTRPTVLRAADRTMRPRRMLRYILCCVMRIRVMQMLDLMKARLPA